MNHKLENIKESISDALDLPKDIILDLPRIILIGNKQIHIENHRGINEYSKELIRIKFKDGCVKVSGNNLQIKTIVAEEIVIIGNIISVDFENRGV